METKVGVIIPMHNCLEYTVAAVNSIKTKFPYQIYIIDDHSDAPTKRWLHARTDITAFIDPPESRGLASNWNLGVAGALNDGCTHLLVANNDILLHPETIDRLVERINRGDAVLVSGLDRSALCARPEGVFSIEPAFTPETEHPEFSCFMITGATITQVGWFDENYEGAYYEDNDYHAQIAMTGHKAVKASGASYFHYGSRTVAENREMAPAISRRAARNGEYFRRKWGRLPVDDADEMRRLYYKSPFDSPHTNPELLSPGEARLAYLFQRAVATPTDINEHLDYLYRLSSTVSRVTAIVTSSSQAAYAFLHAHTRQLTTYYREPAAAIATQVAAARLAGIDAAFSCEDILGIEIEPTDLLFIDSIHTASQVREELKLHAGRALRYLVLHDTVTFGDRDEINNEQGIWRPLAEFVREHKGWHLLAHFPHNNGLTVFSR